MRALGFDNYEGVLKVYLAKYREVSSNMHRVPCVALDGPWQEFGRGVAPSRYHPDAAKGVVLLPPSYGGRLRHHLLVDHHHPSGPQLRPLHPDYS